MKTLPTSLVRFESQLGAAIRRDRRRPRRLATRVAVVTAAAAAVALGVLSALPGGSASAVERAQAALTAQSDSILHVVLDSDRVHMEVWEQTTAPYGSREVVTRDGRAFGIATVNGASQLYDPAANTVYVAQAATAKDLKIAKAKAVSSGSDVKKLAAAAGGDRFRMKILGLLASGKAHEDGRETVAGRDAIRIVGPDVTLLVDPGSYRPIEWRVGNDVTRFPVYERVGSDASILDLVTQHPGATVDRDAAHYEAAFEAAFARLNREHPGATVDRDAAHYEAALAQAALARLNRG